MKRQITIISLISLTFLSLIIPSSIGKVTPPPFLKNGTPWADSIINTLSLDEQIGQLFTIAAYSKKGKEHQDFIVKMVRDYKIGGLIFMQGGPSRQINQLNRYQSNAKIPLMISIDGEWGLAMRLDSTIRYPKQMTLGALRNNSLIEEMGKQIAEQCLRVGINVNFAPVVDVNNNPKNPIINYRSFGENKFIVAEKGIAYMKGMQSNGVLANAKHFPGHGDTESDSHKSLPVINKSRAELDSLELYPFQALIDSGIGSMMVAHLSIPSLGTKGNEATTLTNKVVDSLLKKEMNYKGLVFTDALNMKGVANYYQPGEVDVKALLAGNDVLLFSEDVPTAIQAIKLAIDSNEISKEIIRERAYKILKAKEWLGINNFQKISTKNIKEDLHKVKYENTLNALYSQATTLIKNDSSLLPLIKNQKISLIMIGEKTNDFSKIIEGSLNTKKYFISKKASQEEINRIIKKIPKDQTVIVSLHKTSNFINKIYGFTNSVYSVIESLKDHEKVIFNYPGNPYGLRNVESIDSLSSIIISYEDNEYTQVATAEAILGYNKIDGVLPVSIDSNFKAGTSITINESQLHTHIPEMCNVSSEKLLKIDTIINNAISEKAMPGCQIVILKDGKQIMSKSYGFTTYSRQNKINNTNIYDVASITKIVSSTISLMKLADEGKVNIDQTLGYYIPEVVDSTEYSSIILRDILTHQAKLKPWIPFYKKTLDSLKNPSDVFYHNQSDNKYGLTVYNKMYTGNFTKDSIYKWILETPLREEKKYKYSDLGYYFTKKIVEKISGQTLDSYVLSTFYKPLGLASTSYNPLKSKYYKQITPTELDNYFRHGLIQGTVHDQGAAMMGGVAGHAGVFSNAENLAIIMQLFLNNGVYGGKRYLSKEIVIEFTKAQFKDNRRALGFDKPSGDEYGPTCLEASEESFGHTGFTGTMTWADPKNGIVYVFLSNRTYPSSENRKLIQMNVRTDIQQVIYQAIEK